MSQSSDSKSRSGTEPASHRTRPTDRQPWEDSDDEFMQFVQEINAETSGYATDDIPCAMNASPPRQQAGNATRGHGGDAAPPAQASTGEQQPP